jgi:hypothetical protein
MWRYDVHGLCTIESDYQLDQLSYFSVRDVPHVDLRIRRHHGQMTDGVMVGGYEWDEQSKTLTAQHAPFVQASVRFTDDGVVLTMTPLYARLSNVERLLREAVDYLLHRRDAMLLYAAGVSLADGDGLMLVGPPGVGKSTTSIRLARETGCGLVGDDQILVRDGQLYSYEQSSYLHRSSPLMRQLVDSGDYEPSAVTALSNYLNLPGRSLLPGPLRQLGNRLLRLKPRVKFEPGELAPATDTASLETCLLLYPDDGSQSIRPVSTEAAADRIALLNSWRYKERDIFAVMSRYFAGDTALAGDDSATPRTARAVRAALGDCDCYEVRAPADEQFATILNRFGA